MAANKTASSKLIFPLFWTRFTREQILLLLDKSYQQNLSITVTFHGILERKLAILSGDMQRFSAKE